MEHPDGELYELVFPDDNRVVCYKAYGKYRSIKSGVPVDATTAVAIFPLDVVRKTDELPYCDVVQMIVSLERAIIASGGGGFPFGWLDWKVSELITHLAPNKIRFTYAGQPTTRQPVKTVSEF